MQEPILKAVAMPPKLFWAPMLPAFVNFIGQMATMFVSMAAFSGHVNPLMFIVSFLLVHIIIVIYGTRDPHLSRMMQSYGPFIGKTKNIYPGRGKKLAP